MVAVEMIAVAAKIVAAAAVVVADDAAVRISSSSRATVRPESHAPSSIQSSMLQACSKRNKCVNFAISYG